MITNDTRRIFKSKSVSANEVQDLLQSFFVAELLYPSSKLWLVSPWISDIPIIDNQASKFNGIGINYSAKIKLVEVLILLMQSNVKVNVVVCYDPHNESFLNSLIHKVREKDLCNLLHIGKLGILHSKGILCEHQYYNGSMNITYNGVYKKDETVTITVSKDEIAQASIHFNNEYGDILYEV